MRRHFPVHEGHAQMEYPFVYAFRVVKLSTFAYVECGVDETKLT